MGEDDEVRTADVWRGFDGPAAVAWTRVLRTHWPSWPGMTAIRAVSAGLAEGRPAPLPEWAARAREAERAGFSPGLYERLQIALDAIPAVELPAHPDNEPDPRWPVHTIRAFDAVLWGDWPWLVGAGWRDEEAARLLLEARQALDRPA